MKANTYRKLKRRMFEALLIKCIPLNITLKTLLTNLKIKRCGISQET